MSMQTETINQLTTKLRRFEKEHSQIEGELKGINKQLEDIGINSDEDIDIWIESTKKELERMRKKFSSLVNEVNNLLAEYEDEDND